MVVGLGVDVFDVDRVDAELRTRDAAFFEQIFTADEIADCDGQPRPAAHYAARFAAKEAVLKALAPPADGEVPLVWRDIDIRRLRDGRHDVVLHGTVRALAEHRGVTRILLSVTLARGLALASVVLEAQA
jgi:holo-[acyl-carrier protein] synthase